jgi:predicted Zn-dependent protease
MVSPNTSVRLLAGCPAIGGGAFATSTTSYIGECLLGADHSDAEVAFIVGHERGHVSMQHLSLTYIAQAWARLGLASQTTDSRVIDAALAANLGEFGREQEYEADLTGAVAALSAGFSPSGVDQALTSFGREPPGTGTAASRLQRMSADHPSAAERRQALEAVLGDDFWDADPASGRCPRAAR